MGVIKKIINYLTSRYSKIQLLVIAIVILFAFFVSDSSIFSRLSYDAKIMQLNNEIDYYREQTAKDKQKLEDLEADKDHIEKFARENYLMKKADEDVFIIEE